MTQFKSTVIATALLASVAPAYTFAKEDVQKPANSTTTQQHYPSPARQEYVEVAPNVKLHVTDLGSGQPIVLIPGYPLGDAMWEYQYHALVAAGYRVIGITMRGFGQSDKPYSSYSYDQFAADIKVVLDKLNITNAVIGGHSMGGAIALHYVAKYNGAHISKLALFSAAAPLQTKRPDFPYPFNSKEDLTQWVNLNNSDRQALIGAVNSKFTLTPTSLSTGTAAWLQGLEEQASPYAMEQALMSLRDEDLRADLPKIKVPTLVFNAKEDQIVSFSVAEQLHKSIAGSKFVVFDKSGHASFIEEKDKFNEEFIKFIKE
jgi:pimeloyl-ACP methyl ester carboxylesterase